MKTLGFSRKQNYTSWEISDTAIVHLEVTAVNFSEQLKRVVKLMTNSSCVWKWFPGSVAPTPLCRDWCAADWTVTPWIFPLAFKIVFAFYEDRSDVCFLSIFFCFCVVPFAVNRHNISCSSITFPNVQATCWISLTYR